MKHVFTTILLYVLGLAGYAQTTELSANLNTGFFYFSGESVESTSQINYNLAKDGGYTNNPYGNVPALSYGVSVGINRITESSFKIGFFIGYEVLRSRIDIDQVWQYDNVINESVEAEGQTFLNNSFINIFPGFGYRRSVRSINLDFVIGLEIANCLTSREKGEAKSPMRTYQTDRDQKNIKADIRGRIQLMVSKDQLGGYVGFSNGMKNYLDGYIGGVNEAYSRMIRFGLTYKLK